ncbi:MAG: AAA family ATPase [Thaumarchaeota archaeon]|nr:AAA family ATPase [Nitrososphaerota archaeon]
MGTRRVGKLLGITGTPGTGKKSVAPLVATRLGLTCYSLNDLAGANGLASPESGTGEVDTGVLRRIVSNTILEPAVIYGHLLPYVVDRTWISKVVVLRCDPLALKSRLRARGYPLNKVFENVEAELIGLISVDTLKAFGREKTFEFDTTVSRPGPSSASIAAALSGPYRSPQVIDWLENYGSESKLRSLLSGRTGESALTLPTPKS